VLRAALLMGGRPDPARDPVVTATARTAPQPSTRAWEVPARLAVTVVLTGVAAGAGGAALTLVLHLVQHLAYGYTGDTFLTDVQHASGARRVLAVTAGGALAGSGWWALRRFTSANTSVTTALDQPARGLPVPATTADALLQIVAVGAGASLGREAAPRQLGATTAGWLARRAGLDLDQQRTLLACGAGAGLAAVYNVPLGGAVFTLEVLLVSAALRHVIPAVLTAAIATAVAWPVVTDQPTYLVPAYHQNAAIMVWSVLLGPVAGLVGLGFARLTLTTRPPTGWRLVVAVTLGFAVVGVAAVPYPQLLGNGKGPAQLAFAGALSVPTAAALLVLKPLATAACLRSGAAGGLLTPALATGALLGALTGRTWALLWPGSPTAAFAVVGAAAVLAAAQRAPLAAIVLTIEFTHTGSALLVPTMLAVGGAALTAHLLPRREPR